MLDLVAIAQSSPGAIAINGAIVVGYQLAGLPGVLVSVLGAVLPPMAILSLASVFYNAFASNPYIASLLGGMRAGVAVLVSAFFLSGTIDLDQVSFRMVCYFAGALFLLRKMKWNPILVMVLCGACEMLFYALTHL